MVKLLVEKGADVHAADKHGRIPLSWAATGKFHYSAVNLLLDHGAEPNSRDNNGRSPLSWASVEGTGSHDRNSVVQILLERTLNPNSKGNNGRSAFFWAVVHGYPSTAKLLLNSGADPYCADSEGATTLSIAEEKGWEKVVKHSRGQGQLRRGGFRRFKLIHTATGT